MSMADGKQWYNNPQDSGAGKKPAGKPAGPVKKAQVKPTGKPASGKPAGKPLTGQTAPSGKKIVKPAGPHPLRHRSL